MFTPVLRAVLLAAALLPAARAAAAPLSLDQAIGLAVERSALTRSARAGTQGAAELARAAGQLPDPMLSVGVDNLPLNGPDRFSTSAMDMTMKRIALAQEWVPADRRAARQAVAAAMADREAAMERVAAAEVRLQTAMAYLDAYFAGEAAVLATLAERHAREALEVGKGRLASPAGGSAGALGLAGALGSAEDDSAEQRQQQAAAAANLQRWTGAPAGQLLPPLLPAEPAGPDYVAAHPQVALRLREVEVARHEAELARLARRPNWTVELSYGQRQGRSDLVSFGVSIPWPVAPAARQDRETAAKQAQVDKAEAELEEARRAAAGEHAALSGDAQRLRARIERFQAGVLAPLQQRSAATLAAYRGNQAELSMLFEARLADVEAQRRLLMLRRDLARVQAQLVFKPVSQAQGAAR